MTEKWNMDIRFDKDSSITEEDLSKKDIKDLRQIVRTSEYAAKKYERYELEKTKNELTIIHRMNEAIKILLADLELPPLTISDKAVHIIKVSEYKKNVKPGAAGHQAGGNIFITRHSGDEAVFIGDLSHEIAHDLGYHLKKFLITKNEGGNIDIDINEAIKNFIHNTAKGSYVGIGFTEGMTEIISRGIRRAYSDIAKVGPKQRQKLDKYNAYLDPILVLENIFDLINPDNPDEALYLFAKAYITGDQKIFKIISDKFRAMGIKDGLKILMQMGPTPDDATITAEKLKLKQARKNIIDAYTKRYLI